MNSSNRYACTSPRLRLWAVSLITLGLVPIVTMTVESEAVRATGATVTGTVFHDYNVDGARDLTPLEVGVSGVSVKAYDSTGALIASATTDALGDYVLEVANAATDDIRVEFDTPAGFESSFIGVDAGASVQFTTTSAVAVNYAVHIPREFCQADPIVVSTCFYPGTLNYEPTMGALRSTTWKGRAVAQTRLEKKDVGSIWGVAVQRTTGLIFAAAVIRRHSSLGPKGLGGLYVTTTTGTAPMTSFDLTLPPYGLVLSSGTNYSNAARGIVHDPNGRNSELSLDIQGFNGVGTEGIGDIDVSTDSRYLYVTNLHEKSVVRFELTGTATAPQLSSPTTFNVPNNFCAQTPRPWALKTMPDGSVLVGIACSDLKTYAGGIQTAQTLELPERAVIARLDPSGSGSWSTLTTLSLDHPRVTDFCGNGRNTSDASASAHTECAASRWHPWTNDWANMRGAAAALNRTINGVPIANDIMRMWPQPILTDIEVLDDGSLVVAMSDRLSMQLGRENYQPTNTTDPLIYTWVHGELMLICQTTNGYVQESGGSCGSTYTSNRLEYFDDSHIHAEPVLGGIAVHPSRNDRTIAVSVMDPRDINSSGLLWFDESTGLKDGTGAEFVVREDAGGATFRKAAGMGDVEILCDFAPVQIGDRLWFDLDGDGIQGAGEPPVVGVQVRLVDADGNEIATAITDANGEYRFSSVAATNSSLASGLASARGWRIVIDRASDFDSGGPLSGWVLTGRESGSNTNIDSNATITSGYPSVVVPDMSPGVNIHSLDIGFRTPPVIVPAPFIPSVSVGDRVWLDSNGNGNEDPTEPGIAGVRLTISRADGSPVFDVFGNPVTTTTTDANGNYVFANLPPGTYVVTVSPPAGFVASNVVARQGSATSRDLVTNGSSDLTLDFGFQSPRHSIAGNVWFDVDRDGTRSGTEIDLSGVEVRLTNADGSPVFDVFGNPVTTTTTDANGNYVFADLPPGSYTVIIEAPLGLISTNRGGGLLAGAIILDVTLTDGDRVTGLDVGLASAPRLPVTGFDDRPALLALWLMVFGTLIGAVRRRQPS